MVNPDRRLLLVHAHPDDESITNGVTMAKYASEGAGVTLVTCTLGEMGEVLVPELAHLHAEKDDQLGPHRIGELADAMAELGVTDHRFLGGPGTYRDSGMVYDDNGYAAAPPTVADHSFWRADLREAADHLVSVIREVRPQVLITYDEFGNYGHPDHIQAHRVATYASHLAAISAYRPDLGEAWKIAKTYWTTISDSKFRGMIRALREAGDTEAFGGADPDGTIGLRTTLDKDLTALIESPELVDAKLAAMRAHKTQIEADGVFFAGTPEMVKAMWGSEYYVLVDGTPGARNPETGLEDDLFSGVA